MPCALKSCTPRGIQVTNYCIPCNVPQGSGVREAFTEEAPFHLGLEKLVFLLRLEAREEPDERWVLARKCMK